MTWDEVALDKVKVSGEVLVIDEMADVAAPLTAVKLAKLGARVRLLTKWPMIGWETAAGSVSALDADLSLRGRSRDDHRSCREADQRQRSGNRQHLPAVANAPDQRRCDRDGDGARFGERALPSAAQRGRSVEAIGCAVAPRTVYEATLEGHRAARKLGAAQWERSAHAALQSQASA